MKQIIIKAFHQKQAIDIAKNEYGINIQYDGTAQWKKQGSPLRGFPFVRTCLNIIDNYTDRQLNTGIIINLDLTKGTPHTFKRGFDVDQCVLSRGRLRNQLRRVTEVQDMVTNEIVGESIYKKEALKIAKKHVAKTGNPTCGIAKFVVKDPNAATIFKVRMTKKLTGKLKRFLVVVMDQMGDVKAKGAWHETTSK